MLNRFGKSLLGVGAVGVVFNEFFLYTVPAGHRGVVFDRIDGVKLESKGPGVHVRIPILHEISMLDVRTTPRSISTTTGTKDLQNVNVSLRLLFHPEHKFAPHILKDYGSDYAQRILPSVSNEVLKSTVAQYNADELLNLREQIAMEIRTLLRERCNQFHIKLDDVSLTHLSFSKEFARSIEDKQIQEQLAERAKFVVARAEQEKLARVIVAEGDAEAAALISKAIKDHGRGLLEIRRIETALSLAETLATAQDVTYLPGGESGKSNLLLNVKNGGKR